MIQTNPLLDVYHHLMARDGLQIADYAQAIRDARKLLGEEFHAGKDIRTLLSDHAEFIDMLLRHLWEMKGIPQHHRATLIAVGGYGRRELHPASDIDLLILLTETPGAGMLRTPLRLHYPAVGHRAGCRPQRAHPRRMLGNRPC